MSLILHLETATTVCSVALSQSGNLLALKEENKGFTHAEHLTLFIEEVMQMTGKNFNELSAVAVSKGPGSYTGLRIGVATAKGLCYGLNIPLMTMNTLTSLMYGAQQKHDKELHFCPLLDARRMEVYTALYQFENMIHETAAIILNEDSFSEILDLQKVLFFGDGALKFKEICNHKHAIFDLTIEPSAANMIDHIHKKYLAKEFENLAYFEPYYLKEFYSPSSQV